MFIALLDNHHNFIISTRTVQVGRVIEYNSSQNLNYALRLLVGLLAAPTLPQQLGDIIFEPVKLLQLTAHVLFDPPAGAQVEVVALLLLDCALVFLPVVVAVLHCLDCPPLYLQLLLLNVPDFEEGVAHHLQDVGLCFLLPHFAHEQGRDGVVQVVGPRGLRLQGPELVAAAGELLLGLGLGLGVLRVDCGVLEDGLGLGGRGAREVVPLHRLLLLLAV